MRALWFVVLLGGCLRGGSFPCASNADCGTDGVCEPVKYCSFSDSQCGRRFGNYAGEFSNQCVDDVAGDARFDSPVGDVGSDGVIDGMPIDGPPGVCNDPAILIGRNATNGGTTDSIPNNIVDAFGYVASASGTASCAWVYVQSAPSGAIHFGVYTDNNNSPQTRVATATIASPTGTGWKKAPLDNALTITAGTTKLWLGVITTSGTLQFQISGASCGNLNLHNNTGVTDLPATFSTSNTYPTCNAPLYLGK